MRFNLSKRVLFRLNPLLKDARAFEIKDVKEFIRLLKEKTYLDGMDFNEEIDNLAGDDLI